MDLRWRDPIPPSTAVIMEVGRGDGCFKDEKTVVVMASNRGAIAAGKRMKQGGMKTMPFILANEVAEKLAVVGFSANMITYLTQQLHMPLAKSANTLTNFGGAASLSPLLGAFLADAYIGRFWTITAGSIIYLIGMTSLTISAVLPQLRPPPCSPNTPCKEATSTQQAILYLSLLLTALGAGGIRPCVVAFGAEQLDSTTAAISGTSTERRRASANTWSFFNWYYFCMGASILLAVTAVVWIQDNVGWGWGLGIPAAAMAASVVAFAAGYPMYRMLDPAGSPFTRLLQVGVAAFRKRRVDVKQVVEGPGGGGGLGLYSDDELDAPISLYGKLVHTDHMRFLDKAAVVKEGDFEDDPTPTINSEPASPRKPKPNLWCLSTVHRVEELKSLLRMAPIWAAGILVITASAQQHTFSLQQARIMDRRISPHTTFKIPPGSMTVFTMLAMLSTIALYDRVLAPLARRATGLPRGISFLHRMGLGFALSAVATASAAAVEVRRRNAAVDRGEIMSVYWLVPQYVVFGVAEAFASIGHLEFFYDQAPESMRSTAAALFWLSISCGNYVSTVIVSVVHWATEGPGGRNWLPDDLNRGRLEYLYLIITVLQLVNLAYYCVCARFYTYKPVQVADAVEGHKEDNGGHVRMGAAHKV